MRTKQSPTTILTNTGITDSAASDLHKESWQLPSTISIKTLPSAILGAVVQILCGLFAPGMASPSGSGFAAAPPASSSNAPPAKKERGEKFGKALESVANKPPGQVFDGLQKFLLTQTPPALNLRAFELSRFGYDKMGLNESSGAGVLSLATGSQKEPYVTKLAATYTPNFGTKSTGEDCILLTSTHSSLGGLEMAREGRGDLFGSWGRPGRMQQYLQRS